MRPFDLAKRQAARPAPPRDKTPALQLGTERQHDGVVGLLPGPRRSTEVLRYAAAFATRLHRPCRSCAREFGPVVAIGVGPTRVVALFGAEANEFVFTHDDHFRWREAFEFLVPLDGETALIVSDGADHRRRRRLAARRSVVAASVATCR